MRRAEMVRGSVVPCLSPGDNSRISARGCSVNAAPGSSRSLCTDALLMHSAELNSYQGKQWRGPPAANFRLKSASPAADFRRHLRRLGSAKTGFPAKRHYALRAAAAGIKRNRMRGLIIKLTARTRWRCVRLNTMQICVGCYK